MGRVSAGSWGSEKGKAWWDGRESCCERGREMSKGQDREAVRWEHWDKHPAAVRWEHWDKHPFQWVLGVPTPK